MVSPYLNNPIRGLEDIIGKVGALVRDPTCFAGINNGALYNELVRLREKHARYVGEGLEYTARFTAGIILGMEEELIRRGVSQPSI